MSLSANVTGRLTLLKRRRAEDPRARWCIQGTTTGDASGGGLVQSLFLPKDAYNNYVVLDNCFFQRSTVVDKWGFAFEATAFKDYLSPTGTYQLIGGTLVEVYNSVFISDRRLERPVYLGLLNSLAVAQFYAQWNTNTNGTYYTITAFGRVYEIPPLDI